MTAVLVVEDEVDLAELIADALEEMGLEVTTVTSDVDAYAALEARAGDFAVLIADINLGVGTTGFDVARRARQLNRRLKVVYITGQAAQVGRFGVEDGVMFPKPFDVHELAGRVKALMQPSAG